MGDLLDPAALRAARQWAQDHGHPQPDNRMLAAYGAVIAGQVRQDTADTIARAIEAARAERENAWYLPDEVIDHPLLDGMTEAAAIARRAGDGDGTDTP